MAAATMRLQAHQLHRRPALFEERPLAPPRPDPEQLVPERRQRIAHRASFDVAPIPLHLAVCPNPWLAVRGIEVGESGWYFAGRRRLLPRRNG